VKLSWNENIPALVLAAIFIPDDEFLNFFAAPSNTASCLLPFQSMAAQLGLPSSPSAVRHHYFQRAGSPLCNFRHADSASKTRDVRQVGCSHGSDLLPDDPESQQVPALPPKDQITMLARGLRQNV